MEEGVLPDAAREPRKTRARELGRPGLLRTELGDFTKV